MIHKNETNSGNNVVDDNNNYHGLSSIIFQCGAIVSQVPTWNFQRHNVVSIGTYLLERVG